MGRSIVVKGLQAALQRVAAVDSTVLLTGESGTGKELAALALHRLGPQANALFVPVNCATISPSHIEDQTQHKNRLAVLKLFFYLTRKVNSHTIFVTGRRK